MLNMCCYAKLVFHYIDLVIVVVPVWNIGLFLHQNQTGAHGRRLIDHLKFDVLANSAFVFNILFLKRYKFSAFILRKCAFHARFDGIMTSLWRYGTHQWSMINCC